MTYPLVAQGFQRIPAMLEALEEALCKSHGDMTSACRMLNTSPRNVAQWRQADPEVDARLREAQMIGWASLENAAYERAVVGVDVPIYQKGELVGYRKEYSDGLLAQMLKARVPGYGGEEAAARALTVNVNLMPRASSYEEWVGHREHVLNSEKAKIDEKLPETVIEASFEEIGQPTSLPDVL